jgi:deazaflavin-dependent oxidoreductase (nitroreductase family)
MYRGKRPNHLAALANRGTAAAAAAGIGPKRLVTLEVRGRRTGRRLSLPVVVTEHEGERYLVAMLGSQANWVRNVRADAGAAVLRHGRREHVRLEDVAAGERAPILRRYLRVAPGARAHLPVDRHAPLERFEAIAWRYPVFRICAPVPQAGEEART